jgi:hypothetical protein
MQPTVLDPPATAAETVEPPPLAQHPGVEADPPAPRKAPPTNRSLSERMERMGPKGRSRAYWDGVLSRRELFAWAARYPEEVPLVNGELPWIALGLADLD